MTGIFKKSLVAVAVVSILAAPTMVFGLKVMPGYGGTFPEVGKDFSDVYTNHPYASTIGSAKTLGIVKGYVDGTFAPDSSVSRAEFITMVLASVSGVPTTGNTTCFKDIQRNQWYTKFVCTAKTKGLISGYADKTFRPNNNINFAEASAIISQANKLTGGSPIAMNDIWYKAPVQRLAAVDAIPVTIDTPDQKISRAETAEILWRLKTKTEDKSSKTFETLSSPLPKLSSCAELKDKVTAYQYKQNRGNRYFLGEAMTLSKMAVPIAVDSAVEESAPMAEGDNAAPAPAPGSPDYSTTNVQVEGVDEADVVKNDGEFIYMVTRNTVRIVKAFPAAEMSEVSKLEVSDKNFNPSEIYVDGNKLVVMGSTHGTTEDQYWNRTKVYVIDMTDKKALKEDRYVEFDGNEVSSRRIGNRLYIVTNKYPDFYNFLPETPVEGILPMMRDSFGNKEQRVAGCAQIRFMPRYEQPNFMTVASFDVTNPSSEISKEVIMGGGDTVYSSLENLYVATTQYEYPEVQKFDIWAPPAQNEKTVIFRFDIADGKVTYKGQGAVKGHLLNQFAMDESGNALRVATTIGEVWNSRTPSTNNLFVLDRDNLGTVLGKIEGIAPGERIYSVRFLGKRAYMVTFKKIDPFFVIDVSDNANPKILGELKIPGYSDYLHPFDENHVIGFGKDAVDPIELDKAGFNNNAFDFAWYQGMKIALFDVTDVANPKVLFNEIIGDRGTDSEVLRNHKALMYDKKTNLFAFPITVNEIKDKTAGSYTGSEYGETVFQGAYVYKLDLEKGFQLVGKFTNYNDPEVFKKQGYYWFSDKNTINRIVSIGEFLYGISAGKVHAVSRADVSDVKTIELQGVTDDTPYYMME